MATGGKKREAFPKRGKQAAARDTEQALLNKWGDGSLKERGKRGMELASLRAVERVSALIDSDNPQIALAASREILARVYGMPKQSVDVSVTDTTQAHLAALQGIQERARARLEAQSLPILVNGEQTVNAQATEADIDGTE